MINKLSNTIGIIPARSGSKGVPNKNIANIKGHPLIAYSIAAIKMAGVERVIVSTDSSNYSKIAKKYGAEVPFLRPSEFSQDNSTDYDFMLHAMEWIKKNEAFLPEYWLHIRPTTPLRDPLVIKNAIENIKKNTKATSLRSGHEASESPFKWLMRDEDGFFKGLKDDLTAEKINLPRQLFPPVYVPNGYVDIVKSSHVMKSAKLHGDKMLVFETPTANEIDTKEDFEFVEYQLQKKSTKLLSYLCKVKGN